MSDALIKRDNIYVGFVELGGIIRIEGNKIINLGDKTGDKYISSPKAKRSILFARGNNNRAYDLLNIGYNYPILTNDSNYQEGEHCEECLVTSIFNLGPLLKELGFGEYIHIKELNGIIKYIFTYRFLVKNCHLFGVGLLSNEEREHYREGSTYLSPSYEDERQNVTQIGNTYYGIKGKGVLPVEYFDILRSHNQPTVLEIVGDRILGHYCPSHHGYLEPAPFKPKREERKYRRRVLER